MKAPYFQTYLATLASISISTTAGAATWANSFDGNGDAFANTVKQNGGGVINTTDQWFVITTGVDNQIGTGYVPDLTPGLAAASIGATFDINQSMATDSDEADGAAFFFGAFSENTSALQDSFSLTNGLRLRLHIENNSFGTGPDEAISIFYNDSEIFTTQLALTTDTITFRTVSLTVDAAGAYNIIYNGAGFTNSSGTIAGWAPQSGWQYAVTGRTGGRDANQFLDNMSLSATVPEPSGATLLGVSMLLIITRRQRSR